MAHRINVTEFERLAAEYNAMYQMVHNGASRMSLVVRDIDFTAPYYIALDVPDERELFIFNRELKLSEGQYDIDVILAADGFTGGSVSRQSTLRAGVTDTIQSNLYSGVTPSGAITVLDSDFIDTGTGIGSGNAGGASAIENVMVSIKGQSMIRITKQAGGSATLGVRLIVWEDDV